MWKYTVLLVLLLFNPLAPARDKPESWLEVRSQHFTVVTNANEKTGRRIADQFERMRSVFHVAFPHVSIDNGSPIVVLAIKDEKDFRALEPEAYLAKGQLKLGGSQSYIAHYYFAAISINAGATSGNDAQLERSLRAAIKLNPSFAPAYDSLAVLEGRQHRNLDEAHLMALAAVELEPGNTGYRINAANVLMQMDRGKDAVAVLHGALKVAKTPEEAAMVQSFLTQAEQYVNARNRQAEELKADVQANTAYATEVNGDAIAPEDELPKGPRRFMAGTLQNVRCHGQGIELTVAAKGKTIALHRGNYYKIEFTTLGFAPKGDLSPCKDLEGMSAKVEYVEAAARPVTSYVVAIELHK
jgi:hypothetical protein